MKRILNLFLAGALTCMLSSCMSDSFTISMGQHGKNGHRLPFLPGEKLTYDMVWNLIPVGTFTVEILDPTTIDGTPVWHFKMLVRTNDFADTFYKVRNSVDSFARADLNSSVKYDFIQKQGQKDDKIQLAFDTPGKRVHRTMKGVDKGWLKLPNPCLDSLAMFYAVRSKPIEKAGQIIYVWVSDGNKYLKCPTLVVKKETLTVNDQPQECWLLQPDLKELHGVFQRSKGAKLRVWVTADEHRIPLRVASRVIVGSFQGRLVTFRPGSKPEPGGNTSVKKPDVVKTIVMDVKTPEEEGKKTQ